MAKTSSRNVESAHLLVIGVNTTRPHRHKDGELSAQQIERVTNRLQRAAASQLRIIVVHQPVLAIRESDEDNLLDGHRQAMPAWAAAGGDIIMGGHIHLPYVRSLRTTFGALPRDIWTVQAGTAVSSRIREGITNSVNLIRCDGDPVAAPMHGRALGLRSDAEPVRAAFEPGADVRGLIRRADNGSQSVGRRHTLANHGCCSRGNPAGR